MATEPPSIRPPSSAERAWNAAPERTIFSRPTSLLTPHINTHCTIKYIIFQIFRVGGRPAERQSALWSPRADPSPLSAPLSDQTGQCMKDTGRRAAALSKRSVSRSESGAGDRVAPPEAVWILSGPGTSAGHPRGLTVMPASDPARRHSV